jgi:alpha-glucosidase
MTNNDPKRKEDVKDPIGRLGWPEEKGRDGERTPMQWSGGPNAGFTKGTPWLPVPPTAETHNVAAELKDPNSILQFYKRLLALRHHEPALLEGEYIPLNEDDPNVLAYLRTYKNEAVLVVINMSTKEQKSSFDLAGQGFAAKRATTLLTTMRSEAGADVSSVTLEPFGVYIGKLVK